MDGTDNTRWRRGVTETILRIANLFVHCFSFCHNNRKPLLPRFAYAHLLPASINFNQKPKHARSIYQEEGEGEQGQFLSGFRIFDKLAFFSWLFHLFELVHYDARNGGTCAPAAPSPTVSSDYPQTIY